MMKLLYSMLTTLGLSAAVIPARAQLYLSGLNNYNNGGTVSYYTDSAMVAATGSYSAVNAAHTLHGGKALHLDGPYTSATGSVDSFIGDGSGAWPPVNAVKTISGSVAPAFDIVAFTNGTNQAVDITNSNGMTVATSIYFGNGVTTTVRSNTSAGSLRLLDNATYTSSALSDAQYVNGYVGKIGNDAFTFPVGSQVGNDVRTLQINAPATATDHLSIAYWLGDASAIDPTPSGTQSRTALNPAGTTGVDKLFSVSPICFWDWIPVSGTSALNVTVSLPAFNGNGGYAGSTNMRLVGWNTTTQQWDNLSGATGASGVTEGSTLSGTVPDMSSYSAIAVGSVQEIPLPANIVAFSGNMDNSCNAHLSWQSGVEINVNRYTVEYSADGKTFVRAGEVSANKTGSHDYTLSIHDVPHGPAFFRLMIADNDGSTSYHSHILQLRSACKGAAAITVWPNPTYGAVVVNGMQGKSTINVLDVTGRKLKSVTTTGSNAQLDLSRLSKGIYWLQITGNNNEVTAIKIVKQ